MINSRKIVFNSKLIEFSKKSKNPFVHQRYDVNKSMINSKFIYKTNLIEKCSSNPRLKSVGLKPDFSFSTYQDLSLVFVKKTTNLSYSSRPSIFGRLINLTND